MAGEGQRKLAEALEETLGRFESSVEQVPALLGAFIDGQKTIVVDERPDFVHCRISGNESRRVQAFNSHAGGVAQHFDLPIIIVKDKLNPNVWKVMGRDITRYPDWGKTANYPYSSPYIAHHGGDHSFSSQAGMGADPVWVFKRQMMPLLPHPAISGTMGIEIGSDFYYFDGSYRWFASTGTVDFTPALPTGATNGRFITVYIDGNTGNPSYLTGTEFNAVTPPIDPGTFIEIPRADQGIAVAAIFLLTGTFRIGWGEIYDLRQPHVPTPATGTAGAGVSDHGALTGLGDDDHSQYLLLAGRGGQVVEDTVTITGAFIATPSAVIGPGLATPDGTLHVHASSAGAVTAITEGNVLVVESAGDTGMSILGPDSAELRLVFGSPFDNESAELFWAPGGPQLEIRTFVTGSQVIIRTDTGVRAVVIDANQNVGLASDLRVTGSVSLGGSLDVQVNVQASGSFRTAAFLDTLDQLSTPSPADSGYSRWYSQSGTAYFQTLGGAIFDLTATGSAGGVSDVLGFSGGAATISKGNTDYIGFGSAGVSSTEANQEFYIPIAGTVRNLRVFVSANGSPNAGNNLTIRLNQAATSLTVTYGAGETGLKTDLSNSFGVAVGDTIAIEFVNAGSGGGQQNVVVETVSMELAA